MPVLDNFILLKVHIFYNAQAQDELSPTLHTETHPAPLLSPNSSVRDQLGGSDECTALAPGSLWKALLFSGQNGGHTSPRYRRGRSVHRAGLPILARTGLACELRRHSGLVSAAKFHLHCGLCANRSVVVVVVRDDKYLDTEGALAGDGPPKK